MKYETYHADYCLKLFINIKYVLINLQLFNKYSYIYRSRFLTVRLSNEATSGGFTYVQT